MRVIFLSEIPATLFAGGLCLGAVDGFERCAEMDPRDGVLCEVKAAGRLPVVFRFDEDFLLDPPPRVRLYFSRGSVAVYCSGFLCEDATLQVLRQERVGGTRLTLCRQGRLLLSFENETGFRLVPLPEALGDCTFSAAGNCYLLEGKTHFCILSRAGETLVFSEGKVTERGETVCAEVPFHDSLGHVALCRWKEGVLDGFAVRALREPNETTFALALFESALIGADCTPFLSETLAPKAGALKEYLGAFLSVVLTPRCDEVGLVYARSERIYDVRYFRVTVEDGKIANVAPVP